MYVCGLDSRLGVSVYGGQIGDFTLLFGSKLKMRIIAFQGELWRCRRCLCIYIYIYMIYIYIIDILYIYIDIIYIYRFHLYNLWSDNVWHSLPFLSLCLLFRFGLPDWDGLGRRFIGPSPDGYCGLPDATASSSSSHSWAPKKTASRNGELMGIYWDLTQVIGSLTIAMPKSPF